MIPKIIHYCWFGEKPLSALALKCIDSWKKYCPDYEIKEWNEDNFDVSIFRYSKEAAKYEKWAFVADILRLYAVYNYGGLYFDVDVEMLKPFDIFLKKNMFIGFESNNEINTGQGFGAKKNFWLIKKMMDLYENTSFINPDGTFNNVPCPKYNSKILELEGFIMNNTEQSSNNIVLYKKDFFCPKDFWSGKLNITENTHSIHHFNSSWWSDDEKQKLDIIRNNIKSGASLKIT